MTLTQDIQERVRAVVERDPRILFAYLFGSVLTAKRPGDVDVAVFLEHAAHRTLVEAGALFMQFVAPLETELEARLRMPVDLLVLNDATLSLKHRVANAGLLLAERDPNARTEFECLARVEYFDFRPRREEYLAEVGKR